MTIDYEAAAEHWTSKEADAVRMPLEQLEEEIWEFAKARKVGALACAGNGIVRNTPIEYFVMDGAFYMFSEGGLKFRALEACDDACLAIFDADPSFGGLGGLQVSGKATVVEPFCEEYCAAAKARGLDPERLRSLPFDMNLIRLRPTRFDLLESKLKDEGYDVRQWLEL